MTTPRRPWAVKISVHVISDKFDTSRVQASRPTP